jgi:hypothetical protein
MKRVDRVRICREAVLNRQVQSWIIGDLTLEELPNNLKMSGGQKVGALKNPAITQWIEDIGWEGSRKHLLTLRRVSYAWPKSRRKQAGYAVHEVLAPHPNRFELIHDGMKVKDAYKTMNRRRPVTNRTLDDFQDIELGIKRGDAVLSWFDSMIRCDWSNPTEEQLERLGMFFYLLDDKRERLANLADMVDEMV